MAVVYVDADDMETGIEKLSAHLMEKGIAKDEEVGNEMAREILELVLPPMGVGITEEEDE